VGKPTKLCSEATAGRAWRLLSGRDRSVRHLGVPVLLRVYLEQLVLFPPRWPVTVRDRKSASCTGIAERTDPGVPSRFGSC